MSDPATTNASTQRRTWTRSWPMALPLLGFAALAAIFWFRLGTGDPLAHPLRPDRPPGAANRAAAACGPRQ
jgi:cytochrome c biogenesis protein CcmG/thiol:disulfide interchange protein DsbE